MAFGSWLKNIVGKATSVIGKVLPTAKKFVETVAPTAQKVGGLIGGKVGNTIQNISSGVSNVTNRVSNMVGANGAGIRRLVPSFKDSL